MDKIILKKMTLEDVLEICNWKYEKPYDIYNYPPYSKLEKQRGGIAIPKKS